MPLVHDRVNVSCSSITDASFVWTVEIMLVCNEHGTIYAISSDFGDRMTT